MFKYFPSLIKYKKYIFCENAGGSQIPNQIIDSFTKFVTNNYVQPGANNILSKNISNELNNIDNVVNMILNNKSGDIIYGSSCTQIVYNLANSMENHLKINKKNTSTLPWALDSSDNNLSLKSEIILSNFSHESCITPHGSDGANWCSQSPRCELVAKSGRCNCSKALAGTSSTKCNEKCAPIPARNTLGDHKAAVPRRAITCWYPNAAALRKIDPTLPGSCTASSTTLAALAFIDSGPGQATCAATLGG